jgi:hypothetical protein
MRVRRFVRTLPVVALFAVLPACGDHDYETYVATLEGGQEVPARQSSGTGRAIALVSKSGDRIDVSVTISGLTNVTQAHIHRAPAGTNGGIVFWLWERNNSRYPPTPEQVGRSWVNPSDEPRDTPLTQAMVDELRAGNLYVNFHTTQFPGGEIRGQLRRQ